MATWGLAQAKSKLSEVVYEAEKSGPQTLSRSGRDVAVVISIEEWRLLHGRASSPEKPGQSMADYLKSSPLNGSGLKIPKLTWRMRKLDL